MELVELFHFDDLTLAEDATVTAVNEVTVKIYPGTGKTSAELHKEHYLYTEKVLTNNGTYLFYNFKSSMWFYCSDAGRTNFFHKDFIAKLTGAKVSQQGLVEAWLAWKPSKEVLDKLLFGKTKSRISWKLSSAGVERYAL